MPTKTERFDARFDPETKSLAERAALAASQSLSAYLALLVREDAPKRLKEQQEIVLANERFDLFVEACENAAPPSKKLQDTARKLDQEGF